jgi:hypothetical protein
MAVNLLTEQKQLEVLNLNRMNCLILWPLEAELAFITVILDVI